MLRVTKSHARFTAVAIAMCAALAACQRLADPVPTPNPHPHAPVAVWLHLQDLRPAAVRADATYQVLDNSTCLRVDRTRAIGGVQQFGSKQIDLPVRATAAGFETTASTDRFLQQKYWPEKPACTWTLIAVRFRFEVAGQRYHALAYREGKEREFQPRTQILRCSPQRAPARGAEHICLPVGSPVAGPDGGFVVATGGAPAH